MSAHKPFKSFRRKVRKAFLPIFHFLKRASDPSDLMLSPFEAVKILEERRKNPELRKAIEHHLSGDVPDYLQKDSALYLARHVGTPNFETLRFLYLTRELGLDTVITEDSRGLFVPQNHVKKALAKLSIAKRLTQKDGKLNELYEKVRIVDFKESDGKQFKEIKTLWGEPLIDFHSRLFQEMGLKRVEFPDDADWVDRHHRGKLLDHYKDLLTLFVTHGVFFENYNKDDKQEIGFVEDILRPAYNFVKNKFGFAPLIVQIFPTKIESYDFWISYPSKVLDTVKKEFAKAGIHD